MTNQLPFWLATLYFPNVEPRRLLQWLQAFPDIETFFTVASSDLLAAGVPEKYLPDILQPNWRQVEKDLTWAQQADQHIICLDDKAYPPLLKQIPDPPPVLFVKGKLEALHEIQIAIVGSRHATVTGINHAEKFAYTLSETGFAITSGLAIGIDGASHRGALKAKGKTIAVIGSGLNQIYPPRHRGLAEEITCNGAVVSEFPLDMKPLAWNFPRRNRVIGGLSRGVLVVEAAIKSGSLITARYAMEQGREVFAIPGSIHLPQARGCHYLIREGAILVEKADHILQELQHLVPTRPIKPEPGTVLAPEEQNLLNYIDYEKTAIDVILLRTGLTASEVSSILLTLELDGHIQAVPGGYLRVDPVSE